MTKHTPGPWMLGDSDLRVSQFSIHGKTTNRHSTIARMVSMEHGMAIEEIYANAHLMAAAPDLLEALDELLRETVDMDLKYGIELSEGEELARAKALAAIAKATGSA